MRKARNSLVEFQYELSRKIVARVDEDRMRAGVELGSFVAFESAGSRFLLAGATVSKVTKPSEIEPFPDAKPWAVGVTNAFGSIYVVVDFSVLCGGPRTHGGKLVIFDPAVAGASALLVERLLPMAEEDQLVEDDTATAREEEWFEKRFNISGETHYLINASRLVGSKAFSKLQHSGDRQ